MLEPGETNAAASVRILGIDPGSVAMGYGVVERRDGEVHHVAHGTLRPPRTSSLAARLASLHTQLGEVMDRHEPSLASIEQVFVSRGVRSALVLGQARGVALAAVGARGLPCAEYAPARIKLAVTGSGRASKAQIQRVVRRMLSLERTPAADAADALAIAITHAQAGRLEALGVRNRRSSPRRRASSPVVRVRRSP